MQLFSRRQRCWIACQRHSRRSTAREMPGHYVHWRLRRLCLVYGTRVAAPVKSAATNPSHYPGMEC